jgi:hypothetical protein
MPERDNEQWFEVPDIAHYEAKTNANQHTGERVYIGDASGGLG